MYDHSIVWLYSLECHPNVAALGKSFAMEKMVRETDCRTFLDLKHAQTSLVMENLLC